MENETFYGVLHRFGYDISSQQIRQIQAYHRKLIPLNSSCVQTHIKPKLATDLRLCHKSCVLTYKTGRINEFK